MNTGRRNNAKLLLSRLFYAADLLAGVVKGISCPSCQSSSSSSLKAPGRRLNYFFECLACGLFFRPTGLLNGPVSEFYYSRIYNAGLATSDLAASDAALRARMVADEGKNRNALVQRVFGSPAEGEIAVFGCSWGYEVLALKEAGYSAFGIELSNERRGWGTARLGLPIYDSIAAAARDGRCPTLVLSSHVLEHIPRVEAALDELQMALRPARHIHITPFVDDYRTNPERSTIIGREHPLGITTSFWRHWCVRHRLDCHTERGGDLPGTVSWELVATISPEPIARRLVVSPAPGTSLETVPEGAPKTGRDAARSSDA